MSNQHFRYIKNQASETMHTIGSISFYHVKTHNNPDNLDCCDFLSKQKNYANLIFLGWSASLTNHIQLAQIQMNWVYSSFPFEKWGLVFERSFEALKWNIHMPSGADTSDKLETTTVAEIKLQWNPHAVITRSINRRILIYQYWFFPPLN